MEIIFVGTGSGKTSLKRFHSSLLVKDKNILIDTGDGVSRALLQHNISLNSIESIILTHYHADHYTGIASLITQMKLIGRDSLLKIFTHKDLVGLLNDLLNSVQMFSENTGFELQLHGFNFDEKYFITGDTYFIARKNSHIYPKEFLKAYPRELFTSSSLFIESANKRIVYTSDIGSGDDLYLFKDYQVDSFITETTHIKLNEILTFIDNSHPKKVMLTHVSDDDETELAKWHNSLPPQYKNIIQICYDGLEIRD
ncbi:MAG: MBL fold metallo-hydrolase [Bacteroidota bacterium]